MAAAHTDNDCAGVAEPAPLAMVAANLAWNLVNFREGVIRALVADGWRVMALAPPDPVWAPRLEAMGAVFVPLAIDAAGLSPRRDLALIAAIDRLMREHRPRLWLSWTIKPNVYGALAARWHRVAAIPNVSGLGTAFIRRSPLTTLARGLYRLAFARCPAVFFQNDDDAALFVATGLVRPGQPRLLPGSGIDLAHFALQPRADDPAASAGPRFLMVARLLADKGVREYVAAARILARECPGARFALIGEASPANRTAIPPGEVAAWRAEGLVEILPPTDDVRPVMAAADWIVLPSYREGLSRVLLEAGALGRPAVTTRVTGCQDLVTEGDNGFLAEPRDATSLAAAMRRAATVDRTGWQRMAASARARVEAGYSTDRVVALYRSAIAEATSRPSHRRFQFARPSHRPGVGPFSPGAPITPGDGMDEARNTAPNGGGIRRG